MDNCLAKYDLVQCGRQILVKLDGDDGIPLAVGSFVNGEWEEIRYANNRDARGGGNRACARGSRQCSKYSTTCNTEDIRSFPSLTPFCPRCAFRLEKARSRAQFE